MTDPSIEERLARLQARRQPRIRPVANPAPDPGYPPPTWAGGDDTVSFIEPERDRTSLMTMAGGDDGGDRGGRSDDHWDTAGFDDERRWLRSLRPDWSSGRVAAAGASVVSFASMVVAMSPLVTPVDGMGTGIETGTGEQPLDTATTPTAPEVQIQTSLGTELAPPTPAAQPPVDPAAAEPAAPGDGAAPPPTPAPGPAPVPTAAPATEPPATQPPTTLPPAPQAPPAPTTEPPATQPPATQASTTLPPPPPAPSTAPPTSQASGD